MSKVLTFPNTNIYSSVLSSARAKVQQDNLRIQNGLEPVYSMREIVADMIKAAMMRA